MFKCISQDLLPLDIPEKLDGFNTLFSGNQSVDFNTVFNQAFKSYIEADLVFEQVKTILIKVHLLVQNLCKFLIIVFEDSLSCGVQLLIAFLVNVLKHIFNLLSMLLSHHKLRLNIFVLAVLPIPCLSFSLTAFLDDGRQNLAVCNYQAIKLFLQFHT